jgi:predicted Zn-dependent protease with MMP-like domain
MRESFEPALKAAAIVAFLTGLAAILLRPPDMGGLGDLLVILAGAIVIVLAAAFLTVLMIGREMPESEYRRTSALSDALASQSRPNPPEDPFDELVVEAIDDLPPEFQKLLETTPVLISDRGQDYHAYGLYVGDTVARDGYPDRILIFRDTLTRDFGHDPDLLRAQITRTVYHELAHHLGWNEQGVRDLGL